MFILTGKARILIWALIYILQSLLLGAIVILSITSPQNNLFPWQMAVGTAVGAILLLCAFYFWDRLPCDRLKNSSWLYWALLILFGVLLYVLSFNGHNYVSSYQDYAEIWEAAAELSEGRALSPHSRFYFQTYANNIKPMLYLTALFRISRALRFQDPYFFILIPSVLQVLGAVWSVGILAGSFQQDQSRYRIPILFMFVCTLPIWANVQAFYTDSMSFMMGVFPLALICLSFKTASRWKTVLLLALAGVSAGIGLTAKITVLIPFIAAFIVFCLWGSPRKRWIHIGVFIFCTVLTWKMTDLWAGHYEIWNMSKETSDPVINWIALGMKESGNYLDNADYATYTHTLPTKAEKTAYALQYISDNRGEFWNVSHLVKKIRCNFASGQFGSATYSFFSYNEHNLIWELFSPWGKHYWRTSQLSFCFIFSIYVIYLLGALKTLWCLIGKRAISGVKVIADLSLLGIILFLMIWEANNRQLYNQIPSILLGAVLNAQLLCSHKTGEIRANPSENDTCHQAR